MLIQIILALLIGILVGTLTGLIPGIHINLIGIFIVSIFSTILFNIPAVYFVVFISAMAITHTFIDFIPSIFLGCPDTDTELSILPGHELLKKGHGYQAIILTTYGSLAAIFLLILIAFPSILLFPKIYSITKNLLPYILILVSLILILLENKKFTALKIFLLTGILGTIILNPNEILGKTLELQQPLLPLLTGLFGASTLILSIKNKFQIPEQKIESPKTKLSKPLIGALVASPLCSFLPGLGSGQAAIIGTLISRIKKQDMKSFLVLLGATNTLVMGFSFISLYIISKTRTGAAVAIKEIIGNLDVNLLILILAVTLISGIISFFLTKYLAKFFSQKINQINYTKLSIATLTILLIIIFCISGFLGLGVFVLSTLTGIYCIQSKVRRTQMMGCLLLPTIILYLV